MSYRSIMAKTRGTPGETVWLLVDHICAVTAGIDGLAQVMTLDGKSYFLIENAAVIVQRIWGSDE